MKSLLIIFLTITLYSCQKNQSFVPDFDLVRDEGIINKLKSAYNFSSFNIKPTKDQENLIRSAIAKFKKYNNVYTKLNEGSIRLFENNVDGFAIVMFQFDDNLEKLYSIKGYFKLNEFLITNDYLFERMGWNDNNEKIILTSNNDAVVINILNGKQTISPVANQSSELISIQMSDCDGNHGGTGFCQRQAGEKFSDCYKAEKDEFCDGIWSCIAVDTIPPVMLLIAAACSCSATPCSSAN